MRVSAEVAGAFVLATFAGCASSPISLNDQQISAVERVARVDMAQQNIPGMAIGIGLNGTTVYARGFGTRGEGKPVDAGTIFPIGSITKQFTAACVMLLVQEGRIKLDGTVAYYVPDAPHGREITVRELLDQTSGLADYTAQPALQRMAGPHKLARLRPEQLIALIANQPLRFKPGTTFEYSNTNYVLAGMLVHKVSGEPYGTFLTKHILEPLKLDRMQYLRTSIPAGPDSARGYKIVKGHFVALPRFTMSWALSAGALASDVGDLIRWDGAFFGGHVVQPALVRTMTTVPPLPKASERDYAFGWVVQNVDDHPMIWHNGGLPGAHAMNAYFPQTGWSIVVLTNLYDADPEDIAKALFAIVRDHR